ncbi:MAG: tRNA (adenosine(37)-N6)-dimethylallyltransferase MiaA, partial [Aquificae bacterium]|nr:tRNA (adenosine(37)-N6)-dimethylallyltransferase MiaA [Aquificota bacterium]
QAIGYKEVIPYIEGKIPLEQAVEDVKRNTKKFAKRQIRTFKTKLSNREGWYTINPSNYTKGEVLDTIIEKYKRGGG